MEETINPKENDTFIDKQIDSMFMNKNIFQQTNNAFSINASSINASLNITIDWVRHAESCSNVSSQSVSDINDKSRNISYNKIQNPTDVHANKFSTTANIILNPLSYLKGACQYHPNLSYIGMQHSIVLGTNYLRDEIQQGKYDIVFTSASLRTISTALLGLRGIDCKIFVVPYISEVLNSCSHDNQNLPVRSEILKRQISFYKDWLEKNWIYNFDDIELMTLLNSIKSNYMNQQDVLTIIDTILTCRPNIYKNSLSSWSSYINYSQPDYKQCESTIMNLLDTLIDELKDYNDDNYRELSKFKNKNFIRGPSVDFSILESYESSNSDIKSDFNKFYAELLPRYFNNLNSPPNTVSPNTMSPNTMSPNTPNTMPLNTMPLNTMPLNTMPLNTMPLNTMPLNTGPLNTVPLNTVKMVKILCVSHGAVMRKFLGKIYGSEPHHPMNTQVFRQTGIKLANGNTSIDTNPNNIDYTRYVPPKLRSEYENFEIFNKDVCLLEGLKGIVNYPLWDPNNEESMVPKKYQTGNYALEKLGKDIYTAKNIATPDVQFYFDNKEKYQAPQNQIITGGHNNYRSKYIKYKIKYQRLKSKTQIKISR